MFVFPPRFFFTGTDCDGFCCCLLPILLIIQGYLPMNFCKWFADGGWVAKSWLGLLVVCLGREQKGSALNLLLWGTKKKKSLPLLRQNFLLCSCNPEKVANPKVRLVTLGKMAACEGGLYGIIPRWGPSLPKPYRPQVPPPKLHAFPNLELAVLNPEVRL